MTITISDLAHFNGSPTLSYDPFIGTKVNYTEGVRYLVHNGCHWLFVDIASHLIANPVILKSYEEEQFIVIDFKKTEDGFDIEFSNDEGEVLAVEHRHTVAIDCNVKFFYIDNVLMIASEY